MTLITDNQTDPLPILTSQNLPPPSTGEGFPWLLAIRPRTLGAAFAPVAVGSALAFDTGAFHPGIAFGCLIISMTLQISTNLVNDYCDFKKGADTPERLGPIRVTQSGLLSPDQVLRGAILSFCIATLVGAYFVWLHGWLIALLGIACIASCILYTAGPFALAYLGLGEVFVIIFFGLVAVLGTLWLQTQTLSWTGFWAALGLGFLASCLLCVNNIRDRPLDMKAGKRTLAVRLGPTLAPYEYIALMSLVALCVLLSWWNRPFNFAMMFVVLFTGLGFKIAIQVLRIQDPRHYNSLFAQTGMLLTMFGLTYALSFVL